MGMRGAGWKNNDGQALVLVMMVISVLFVLTASLGTITSHTRGNVISEQRFTQALYAADAGIEKTAAKIINDVKWYTGLPYLGEHDNFAEVFAATELADNVTFQVGAKKTDQRIGTSVLLNSVGRYLDGGGNMLAQKTLRSEVAVFAAGDYFQGFSILPEDPLYLGTSGNMTVNADLILNGSLDLRGSTRVNGDVFASGTVSGNSTGAKYSNYPYIPPFPDLDESYYRGRAMDEGQVYYSDTTFANPGMLTGQGNQTEKMVAVYSGFYYVDGNINISGDYRGTAVFFTTGDVNITGNLEPKCNAGDDPDTSAGNLTLIASGNINIDNYTVYANLMARGVLGARENAKLYGSACVTGIDFGQGGQGSENFTMYYGSDLAPNMDSVPVGIKIIDWGELYPVF